MIHNKHFQILDFFTADYCREIYGRELIGKVGISQKGIALALQELEREGVLKSRKKGNMKFFSLNLKYLQTKDTLFMAETAKKIEFFSRNKETAHIFRNDDRIIGIFGSYAKKRQRAGSDMDIFIIGGRRKEDYDKKSRAFDLNISIKYFTEREFKNLLNSKNNLIKEIIGNHVLVFGIERFINLLWREYYGFD